MALSDGLYDLLLTEGLARSLAALDPGSAEVLSLKGGAPELLVDVITRQLGAILDDVAGDDTDRPRRQLELVNELLVMLRHRLAAAEGLGAKSGSAEVIDLVAQPCAFCVPCSAIDSSRHRPRSVSRLPGCSRPERARRHCFKRSVACECRPLSPSLVIAPSRRN